MGNKRKIHGGVFWGIKENTERGIWGIKENTGRGILGNIKNGKPLAMDERNKIHTYGSTIV